jgi:hypothetical protein
MSFQGMGCRRFCRWVSLSIRVPLANLVRGSVYRELEGGLQKWSISLYGSSPGGTWRHKTQLWRLAPLSMGASMENLGKGSYARGLWVEEVTGTGVSPYRGPIQRSGEGCRSTGNFERWMKGAMGWGVSH